MSKKKTALTGDARKDRVRGKDFGALDFFVICLCAHTSLILESNQRHTLNHAQP
ncbi:MAG: hypothetical protein HY884_05145 [Deltaproteobacteria bacterium]|nr:hypothetical protein [Deltaproteobacteria bacterium]